MSLQQHTLGTLALLAVVVPVALGAFSVRRRILPTWAGSSARLAEAIIGLATVVFVAELLGAVGLFGRTAVVVTSAAVGIVLVRVTRPAAPDGPLLRDETVPELIPVSRPIAIAAVGLVGGEWATHIATS